MYDVVITPAAERDIKRFDRSVRNRISPAIAALADNPRPVGCLKIRDAGDVWRIRVGDYRIGYQIDDDVKMITIVSVGHRSDFYR